MKEADSSVFSFEAPDEPEPLAWNPKQKGSAKKQRPSGIQISKVKDGFFSNVRNGKPLSLKDDPRPHAIGENAKRLRRLLTASPREIPRWAAEQLAATFDSLRRRHKQGDLTALSLVVASEDPKEPWIIQEPWFKRAVLDVLKEVLPAIPREWHGPSTEEVRIADEAFSEGERFYRRAKKALRGHNNSTTIRQVLAQQLNRSEEEIEHLVSLPSGNNGSGRFINRLSVVVKDHTLREFSEKWAALQIRWAPERVRRHFHKIPPTARHPKP